MAIPSHPFPVRNPAFMDPGAILDVPDQQGLQQPTDTGQLAAYTRSRSPEAKTHRLQYLTIEESLDESFRYVSPCDANADTFSFKFAEIIRSAANMYELVSKHLYRRFYAPEDDLNIFNYLALDIHLGLADQSVLLAAGLDDFPSHPEVTKPFAKLIAWDKLSEVTSDHVPEWWNAYNAIKHADFRKATLANAIEALASVFLVIDRIYGFGVLAATWRNSPTRFGSILYFPGWSRVFSLR